MRFSNYSSALRLIPHSNTPDQYNCLIIMFALTVINSIVFHEHGRFTCGFFHPHLRRNSCVMNVFMLESVTQCANVLTFKLHIQKSNYFISRWLLFLVDGNNWHNITKQQLKPLEEAININNYLHEICSKISVYQNSVNEFNARASSEWWNW